MNFIDTKKVRLEEIKSLKKNLEQINRKLGIAIIQIGDDSASNIYIKNQEKLAQELDYEFKLFKFDCNINNEEVIKIIDALNNDNSIDGILLQLPIPKNLNIEMIQNRISPAKDVDGLTCTNIGKLNQNSECLIPSTASAIMSIFKYYNIKLEGAHIVILGRSNIIGRPLFNLLINNDATVTLCHSKTRNLKQITNNADIIVTATGKINLIKKDMVKDNAIIIDCGINVINGKIQGDVDIDDIKDKKCYITKVPNGVGAITVVEVFKNVYKAYKFKNK